jgi:hypothetical protein
MVVPIQGNNPPRSTMRCDSTAKVVHGDDGGIGPRPGLGGRGMVPAGKGVGVAPDTVKRHRSNTAHHATASEDSDSQQGSDTVKRHRTSSNTAESLVREDVQGEADVQPGIDEVSEGDPTGGDEGSTGNDDQLSAKVNIEPKGERLEKLGLVAAPARTRTAAQLPAGSHARRGNRAGGATLSRSQTKLPPDMVTSIQGKNPASSTTRPDCTAMVVPGDDGGMGPRPRLGGGGMVPAATTPSQAGTARKASSKASSTTRRDSTAKNVPGDDGGMGSSPRLGVGGMVPAATTPSQAGTLAAPSRKAKLGGARDRDDELAGGVGVALDTVTRTVTPNLKRHCLNTAEHAAASEDSEQGGETRVREDVPVEADVQPGIDEVSEGDPTGGDEGSTGNDDQFKAKVNIEPKGEWLEKLGLVPAATTPSQAGTARKASSKASSTTRPDSTAKKVPGDDGGMGPSPRLGVGGMVPAATTPSQAGTLAARKAKLGGARDRDDELAGGVGVALDTVTRTVTLNLKRH